MVFYTGYAVFEGTVSADGIDAVPIVLKVQDEKGKTDGILIVVHPDDLEYIRRALHCFTGVGRGELSDAMLNRFRNEIGNNGG